MKPMRFKDLEALLQKEGFVFIRSSKHIIYGNGSITIAVPHTREVSPGTLRDIFRTIKQSKQNQSKQNQSLAA